MLIPCVKNQVSDQVALEIASCIPGSSVAHWSVPRLASILVTQYQAVHLENPRNGDGSKTLVPSEPQNSW